MKKKCPKCGTGKARRLCARQGHTEICSECCASIRDADCGDCVHYAAARQYEMQRSSSGGLPDGHFIAEINPAVQVAVDDALQAAQRGDTQRAMASLTALHREHPRNHDVCFGIGTIHGIREEHDEAIKWLDKAIQIFPYSMESHFNKAGACRKTLDISNAVRSYRKVVELGDPRGPEVADARSFIADMEALIRKTDGIELKAYLQSVELFNEAFALMEGGDWQGALVGFRASSALNERNAPCHGNMGLCHARRGEKAMALAELGRALEIDPDYTPARQNREVVRGMAEGRPLENVGSKTVSFSTEKARSKRP